MDEYQELAHDIMHIIEDELRKVYPFIDQAIERTEWLTLFYGELYYTLEGRIAEMVREFVSEKLSVRK